MLWAHLAITTDMNAEPAELRHLMFYNLGKVKDKKLHI